MVADFDYNSSKKVSRRRITLVFDNLTTVSFVIIIGKEPTLS